jgi:nitrogen PTS system EIIA component
LVTQDYLKTEPQNHWFNRKRIDMKIADFIDRQCITFLQSIERDAAIKELVDLLYTNGKIKDKNQFLQSVLAREELVSTGVGMQVAIPHAKHEDFSDFFIAIGIQKNTSIEWHSLDKIPVRLIFLIGGPENQQTKYLKILSSLTQVIKDEKIRKQLLTVSSAEEIGKIFAQF